MASATARVGGQRGVHPRITTGMGSDGKRAGIALILSGFRFGIARNAVEQRRRPRIPTVPQRNRRAAGGVRPGLQAFTHRYGCGRRDRGPHLGGRDHTHRWGHRAEFLSVPFPTTVATHFVAKQFRPQFDEGVVRHRDTAWAPGLPTFDHQFHGVHGGVPDRRSDRVAPCRCTFAAQTRSSGPVSAGARRAAAAARSPAGRVRRRRHDPDGTSSRRGRCGRCACGVRRVRRGGTPRSPLARRPAH